MEQTQEATYREVQNHAVPLHYLGQPNAIGRYRVREKLGEGGMGRVYLAEDLELDRLVAIKLLTTRGHQRADDYARASQEARALARLSHPNVVQVYEVGEYEDQLYIAMQYVPGLHLGDWIRARGRAKRGYWRETLARLIEAGRGLEAAHRQGLIHCDFKPENVLINRDTAMAQVADFGVARPSVRFNDKRADNAAEDRQEEQIAIAGTRGYMAPELLDLSPPSELSDQYSFCVTLWWALTGLRTGESTQASGALIARPFRSYRMPLRLRLAVQRGLASAPEDRWPSMRALLLELERILARRTMVAASVVGAAALIGAASYVAVETAAKAECTGAAAEIDHVWNTARAQSVRNQFETTLPNLASDFAERLANSAQAYADHWQREKGAICQEHLRAERTDATYARALTCFAAGKRYFSQIIAQLDGTHGNVARSSVLGAVAAVEGLPSPSLCTDHAVLAEEGDSPTDPAQLAIAGIIDDRLAQAASRVAFGTVAEVQSLLDDTLAQARTLGHAPTLAKTLVAGGSLYLQMGHPATAMTWLTEALDLADGEGLSLLVAQAWRGLLTAHVALDADVSRGEEWSRRLQASVSRLDSPPPLAREMLLVVARFERSRKNFAKAQELFERARTLAAVQGADYAQAKILADQASLVFEQGRAKDAIELVSSAMDLLRISVGEDHPEMGDLYAHLGAYLVALSDAAGARQAYAKALRIFDKLDEEHSYRKGNVFFGLAEAQDASGSPQLALKTALAAENEMRRSLPAGHRRIGDSCNLVGGIYHELERFDEATDYYQKANAIWSQHFSADSFEMLALRHNIATVELAAGDAAHALQEFTTLQPAFAAKLGDEHSAVVVSIWKQAEALFVLGNYTACIERAREALRRQQQLAPDRQALTRQRLLLARALAKNGAPRREWEPLAKQVVKSLQLWEETPAPSLLQEIEELLGAPWQQVEL